MILTGTLLATLQTAGAAAAAGHIGTLLSGVGVGLTHLTLGGDHTLLTTASADPILHAMIGVDPILHAMIGKVIIITVADPTLAHVLLAAGHQSISGTGPILHTTLGITHLMMGSTDEPVEETAAYHPGGDTTRAATHPGQGGVQGGATLEMFPRGLGEAQGELILAAFLQVQGGGRRRVMAPKVILVGAVPRVAVGGQLLGWFQGLSLRAQLLRLVKCSVVGMLFRSDIL